MEINDVLIGISIKLDATFGSDYTVYVEDVPQEFKTPAFFIALLDPSMEQLRGERYKLTLPFDIHYFGSGNMEAHSTLSKLMKDMEYITLVNTDTLRGTNMNGQIVDGVLHFFVNYNVILVEELVQDFMDSLEQFSNTPKG